MLATIVVGSHADEINRHDGVHGHNDDDRDETMDEFYNNEHGNNYDGYGACDRHNGDEAIQWK